MANEVHHQTHFQLIMFRPHTPINVPARRVDMSPTTSNTHVSFPQEQAKVLSNSDNLPNSLQLTCTRGPKQSEHDCHMQERSSSAGVMNAGLLTSACPTARHTHPPCAARSSGTIAPWAAPTTTTKRFRKALAKEKAGRDDTYAFAGNIHEATALQRRQVLGPVGRRLGGGDLGGST